MNNRYHRLSSGMKRWPRTQLLPSGLSPSAPEFHRASRPSPWVSSSSRAITAGGELHPALKLDRASSLSTITSRPS